MKVLLEHLKDLKSRSKLLQASLIAGTFACVPAYATTHETQSDTQIQPVQVQSIQAAADTCRDDLVTLFTSQSEVQFSVELADSPEERSRGLMFREEMAPFSGMLFVYERPQTVHFWMKNTLIPLDMIFADETGTIVSIHQNAIPHDLTAIFGGDNIFAVLELNAGMSERLSMKSGDILQHPAFKETAVQNCSTKNDG